jgi:hypothetical protein
MFITAILLVAVLALLAAPTPTRNRVGSNPPTSRPRPAPSD